MKVLFAVALFAILGAGLAKKFTEEMLTPGDKECIQELALSSTAVLDNISDNLLLTEGNADFNKFNECAFRKMDALDENNALKKDVLKPLMVEFIGMINSNIEDKEKAALDAFEACKEKTGSDVGDSIVKYSNCFVNFVENVTA